MSTKPPGYKKATIAYLTFIGMLIAYFMNRDERHDFATWHIRNMFGLVLLLLISQVTMSYIHEFAGWVIWLCAFAWWIFSIIMCLLGKKGGIPGISDKFQRWFTFIE